ncbi:MAG TPA: hypothetical protein VEU32_19410 [Burkholderiales bacterium]|nr:hypothetical protein [Burkholderiales bacterium]
MLEATAHELHEDLKLTPQPSGRAVVQKVDRIVDVARDRLTALEDIAQAAKDLYAKLTPEQQSAADPRLANLMTMPLGQPGGGPAGPGRRPT